MEQSRLSYEDSCRRLQDDYIEVGSIPPIPDHLPQFDDAEPLGVSFFRTFVGEGDDLSNLTLPRTFFGRSEINDALFRNTDFSESNLSWNEFISVDFTGALLSRCDLRASNFREVKFNAADLSCSDLRHASFKQCDFTDAKMNGTMLTAEQGNALHLSQTQRAAISWTVDAGPVPNGG